MRVRLKLIESTDSRRIMRVAVRDAINMVEEAGLKVYRQKKQDGRVFMKIYAEPLDELLPKVSGNAIKIFLALGNRLGWENTIVELSREEIQQRTNLSEKTVREGLNELEKYKVLSRIGANVRRKYVLNEMYIKRGK